MSENMLNKDIRTLGYVLRRTNYGEADRILNIITPLGKMAVIAKGARKSKSKLAGGVEIFSLVDFNLHLGRGEFGIATGARMVEHYGNILKDFASMELAGVILKEVARAAEGSDNPEYFEIVGQGLVGLDGGMDVRLVRAWFGLNLRRAMGEEVNLYRDTEGEKLVVDKRYSWDETGRAFCENTSGRYGADDIKMLRLMSKAKLAMVEKVKVDDGIIDAVLDFARVAGCV